MFRRFWPTKWVYGNRRHWCNFKDTINWLIWNDVELVGLQNCYLGLPKFWKISKISKNAQFFLFSSQFPPNQNFQKTVTYVRGQCHKNRYVYKISSLYLPKWLRYNIKHVKNRRFSRYFGTLPWFSEFCFLTDFDVSKSVFGTFSRSLWKSDLKTCIAALNHDFFYLFHLVTLTCIMVTTHRNWYLQMSVTLSNYPCRFIGLVCA